MIEKEERTVLFVALLSRCVVFSAAILSHAFVGDSDLPGIWRARVPFFNLFAVWDSGYYMAIAGDGYARLVDWSFFPFYPLLVRALSFPFAMVPSLEGESAIVIAGFLLSNLSFFISVIFFYRLTLLLTESRELSRASSIFFAVYPASMFSSAVYTEGLFLLLMIASLLYVENGRFRSSALLGFLSALTRFTGFLITLPLLYITSKKDSRPHPSYPVLPVFGTLVFAMYGYLKTGNVLVYLTSLSFYFASRRPGNPLHGFEELGRTSIVLIPIFVFLCLASLLSFFLSDGWRRSRLLPYYLYSSILFALFFFSGNFLGFPRYSASILPVYWFLGRASMKGGKKAQVLIGVNLLLLIVCTSLFVNWYEFM